MLESPQKPARPLFGAARAPPSLSVNLENVNLPNVAGIRLRAASPALSPATDAVSLQSNFSFDQGAVAVGPDQASVLENELEMLMNDEGGILGTTGPLESQIQISKLVDSTIDKGVENAKQIADVDDSSTDSRMSQLKRKKRIFVLSEAGKPIYSLFGIDSDVVNYTSVIQTLISSFEASDLNPEQDSSEDELRSFKAGSTTFLVMNKKPVFLVAISGFEFESVPDLKGQLYIVYNYILSILSRKQLVKFYENKANFDLTNVLNSSDFALLERVLLSRILNPVFFLNGVESFYLSHGAKMKINNIIEKRRTKDMLYGILTDLNGKVVTIMKPKRHYLHTTDLQILLSLVKGKASKETRAAESEKKIVINRKIVKEAEKNEGLFEFSNFDESEVVFSHEEELWFPICLPEFNPNGFLYCFVNYIDVGNIEVTKDKKVILEKEPDKSLEQNKLIFIVLSPDRNSFFEIRNTSKKMILEIILTQNSQVWTKLIRAFKFNYKLNYLNFLREFNQRHPSMNIIKDNNFFHFIFKSRKNSQVFVPSLNSVIASCIKLLSFQDLIGLYKELAGDLIQPHHRSVTGSQSRSYTPFNGLSNTFNGFFSGATPETKKPEAEPASSKSNLVYLKWRINEVEISGVGYSNSNYEIYVLLKDPDQEFGNKKVIVENVKVIINWIFKNFGRLFIEGVTF